MAEEPTKESLTRARDLYINNVRSDIAYSFMQALIDAGVSKPIASEATNQRKVKMRVEEETAGSSPTIDMSENGKLERFKTLYRLLYEGSGNKDMKLSITDIMLRAGFKQIPEIYKGKNERGNLMISKLYAKCNRSKSKIVKEVDKERAESQQLNTPPVGVEVNIPETIVEDEDVTEVSPISDPSESEVEESTGYFFFDGRTDSYSLEPLPEAQKIPRKSNGSSVQSVISSLTGDSVHTRNSLEEAQKERQNEEYRRHIGKCAHKVGTFLYSLSAENPLQHLKSANGCANYVNRLFGLEMLSGRQLRDAIRRNEVGKSPPRKGRPTAIPEEEFDALCDAFWTMSAIEQNNVGSTRLNRQDERNLLDDIVTEKRGSDNRLDAVNLMGRINQRNAPKQKVKVVDSRQQIWRDWCTKHNQLKHYLRSEEFHCARGYARLPRDEKERMEEGYIVFYPKQEKKNINMDEMKFTLDATKENPGGRPGTSHTTSAVPEGGMADATPGTSATIALEVNDTEPLPLLVIIPTTAKHGEGRINAKTVKSFPQIKGTWGYEEEVVVDNYIATSPNGSMTKNLLEKYQRSVIQELYPDVQDVDGKRICFKLDSGPGRSSGDFLAEARVEGIDIHPGMPNGSEVNREMDQLFSPFKNSVYRNRKKLVDRKGKLSLIDIGYCLFGGTVELEDGSELELERAYEIYFSPARIRSAREKCGYCPATRNALHDPKLRGEIDEDSDGEDDEVLRSMTDVLVRVEQLNHKCVDGLVNYGYSLATKLKRTVTRVKKRNFGAGVTTEPGSRERQELYAKMRYRGDHFRITDGGGLFNTGDVLIGYELKNLKKQVATEEARKKGLQSFYKVRKKAASLMQIKNKHYMLWKKSDFITAIKYKQGALPERKEGEPTMSSLQSLKLEELKKHYEENYKGEKSAWHRQDIWTDKDEEELKRL